jgi:hypothetical protein
VFVNSVKILEGLIIYPKCISASAEQKLNIIC